LNLEGIAVYKKGIAQANYASAQFSARQQDLVVRVVGAYIEAQNSDVVLALAIAQRDALLEQRNSNQRMFEHGEGTKTDVLEAQSKYDAAEAQVLEAQDTVTNNRNVLAALVGSEINSLDPLSEDFEVKPLMPSSFDEWKTLAMERNSDIEALRYAVEANQQDVNRARASNAPRVDLTASLSSSDSETINTLNQKYKARSIGVQVSIPLYSGGYAMAASRQSVANREKTKSDLDAKTGQVMVELRKQYNLTFSSIKRMDALKTAVKSAELLVEATRQSIKGGVRVNLDLLNAQQQMFAAKRDLAQGRYGYLLSYMRLRNAAGVLEGNDLQNMASYFSAGR
jgi:protease secretion system outer membrane protein